MKFYWWLVLAMFLPLQAQAYVSAKTIGALQENKMQLCEVASSFAPIAATLREHGATWQTYMNNVTVLVTYSDSRQDQKRLDTAKEVGRFVFRQREITPISAQEVVYHQCVAHPEKFRVVY